MFYPQEKNQPSLEDFKKPLLDFVVPIPLNTCKELIENNLDHRLWQKYPKITRKEIRIEQINETTWYFTVKINFNNSIVYSEGFLNHLEVAKTRILLGKGKTPATLKAFFLFVFGVGGGCSTLAYLIDGDARLIVFGLFFFLLGYLGYMTNKRLVTNMITEAFKNTFESKNYSSGQDSY